MGLFTATRPSAVTAEFGETHRTAYCDLTIKEANVGVRIADNIWTIGQQCSIMILTHCCQAIHQSKLKILGRGKTSRWWCENCETYSSIELEPFISFFRENATSPWRSEHSPALAAVLSMNYGTLDAIVWQEEIQNFLAEIISWAHEGQTNETYNRKSNDEIIRGISGYLQKQNYHFTLEGLQ